MFNPGGSVTIGAANGGKVYAINTLGTSPVQVIGSNFARRSITFHNPSPSIDAFVAPVVIQTTGSDVAFTPSTSALGGCIRVMAGGGTLVITGECTGAWQAFSASGSGNPLTILDSNT